MPRPLFRMGKQSRSRVVLIPGPVQVGVAGSDDSVDETDDGRGQIVYVGD